jgi:tyrosinase
MVTRRGVLAGGSAALAIFLIDETAAQTIRPRRLRIHSLADNHPMVETYRDGVRLLKASRGPVSWSSIAAIHGNAQGFNRCPHGNWYFLPWHRAYLVMLENIIRNVTGNAQFALPYWDWSTDPRLPPQFARETVNGRPNALFEARRYIANTPIPADVAGEQEVMAPIYEIDEFEQFASRRPEAQDTAEERWVQERAESGPLESGPHDTIHGIVGGRRQGAQPSFMRSAQSALDPVFWLHHCNIDRIWAVWNQRGGVNTDSELWLETTFTDHFLAPDGASYSARVADLQRILPLGYRYGLPPQQPPRTPQRPQAIAQAPTRSLTPNAGGQTRTVTAPARGAVVAKVDNAAPAEPGAPLEVPVRATGAAGAVRPATRSLTRLPAAQGGTVLAIVRGIDAADPGATRVRVFLNKPGLTAATPPGDPHYVTSFGFFGGEHGGHTGHGGGATHSAKPSIVIDLTPTIARLQAQGIAVGDDLRVQFVVVSNGPDEQAGRVVPASVEVVRQ